MYADQLPARARPGCDADTGPAVMTRVAGKRDAATPALAPLDSRQADHLVSDLYQAHAPRPAECRGRGAGRLHRPVPGPAPAARSRPGPPLPPHRRRQPVALGAAITATRA